MNQQFALQQMLLQAWPVMSILCLGSILSISVIWNRVSALRQARLDARGLASRLSKIVAEEGIQAAAAYCRKYQQPGALVFHAVLVQRGSHEARARAGQNQLQACVLELEKYLPILGTIGSIAPFVGLFGTVIGIIQAFIDIARNAGGGIEIVAAGIGEALITTAAGLFVAIPAIIGYNYCISKVRRMTEEVDLAMNQLLEDLSIEKKDNL